MLTPVQGFADPRNAAAGWLDAWRGWRDNPLAAAYLRAVTQRETALPWFRRSPGLLFIGILLSVLVTGVNLWLLVDAWRLVGPGARPFIAANASLGIGVSLAGLLLFSLCWLTARCYSAYSFALGFLERAPRTRFRHSLDDMLAVTALTEQELLVGALQFGLGRLALPLATCCASMVLLALRLLPSWSDTVPLDPGQAAMIGLAFGVMLWTSGMLTNAALLLLGIALSIAEQSGPWPAIGAWGLVVMQPLFAAGVAALTVSVAYEADQWSERIALWVCGTGILLLVIGLMLYLARRIEALRRGLAAALGPMLLLPYVLVVGGLLLNFENEEAAAWLLQPLQLLITFNPQLLLNCYLPFAADFVALQAGTLLQWLSLLPLQLVFILLAAEFARDSIRRRKWGNAA